MWQSGNRQHYGPLKNNVDTPASESSAAAEDSSRRRRDLNAIFWEGAAYHVMVGAGESYLGAFCLAIGAGELAAGLVATVPLVVGATAQLTTPWALAHGVSHRQWAIGSVVVQALSLVWLAWGAWRGQLSTPALFAGVACYFGAGLAVAPAWNTWCGRLVPVRYRARFFARRTRVGQACLLAAFLLAGTTLQLTARSPWVLTAFAILFLSAALARMTSAMLLASHQELPPGCVCDDPVTLRDFWNRATHGGSGRLLVYLLLVQGVVQISGPFFTPYMLKQLRLPYLEFALLTACAYLAKVAALPSWGRVAQRWGAERLLLIGGVAVTPVAALWLVSRSLPYLMCVQVLSGVAWAAYELAIFLLFFESVSQRQRTGLMTAYNFFHAWATLLGSLTGAALLTTLGRSPQSYKVLFATSSLGRALTLFLLLNLVPGVALLEVLRRRASPAKAGRALLGAPHAWRVVTDAAPREVETPPAVPPKPQVAAMAVTQLVLRPGSTALGSDQNRTAA